MQVFCKSKCDMEKRKGKRMEGEGREKKLKKKEVIYQCNSLLILILENCSNHK
jgi:hypothetical protein